MGGGYNGNTNGISLEISCPLVENQNISVIGGGGGGGGYNGNTNGISLEISCPLVENQNISVIKLRGIFRVGKSMPAPHGFRSSMILLGGKFQIQNMNALQNVVEPRILKL